MTGGYQGQDPTHWVYGALSDALGVSLYPQIFEDMPERFIHYEVNSHVDSAQVGWEHGARTSITFISVAPTDIEAHQNAVKALERLQEVVDREIPIHGQWADHFEVLAMPRAMRQVTTVERRDVAQHIFSVDLHFTYRKES